ncbi:hypothetical protein ACFQ4C_02300 [Larkinella insperata]|uniref:Uncharacterized protein n=1 Tax=Larkinella insperata TaxID=332158 RepID=A0ABW3Q9B0_9BACT|nr:hypothetical protein [Larkinella insperata]
MKAKKIVLLPYNLDLESLLEEHPPQVRLQVENLKYILGLISELPAYDHRLFTSQQEEALYVSLNAKLLKEKVSNYHHYLRYLQEVSVLECDNAYVPGFKSRGYRFTQPYQGKLIKDVITRPKLVSHTELEQQEDEQVSQQYGNLIRPFDGLKIDNDQAQQYIDGLYEEESHSPQPKIRQNAACRYGAYQTMINHLSEHTGRFKVDSKGHRFHSPLTNLKKELRQFLTYKGEPLVALDLSCSQSYLATLLFNREFYQPSEATTKVALISLPAETQALFSKDLLARIVNYIINFDTVITSNPCTSLPPSPVCPLMVEKSEDKLISKDVAVARESIVTKKDDEVKTYLSFLIDGKFYELLGEQIQRETGRSLKTRQQMKEVIFTVLFSKNGEKHPALVSRKEAFVTVFPWIYGLFELLKSDKHSSLALLLQTIESEIFLNRIAQRITAESSNVPFF